MLDLIYYPFILSIQNEELALGDFRRLTHIELALFEYSDFGTELLNNQQLEMLYNYGLNEEDIVESLRSLHPRMFEDFHSLTNKLRNEGLLE